MRIIVALFVAAILVPEAWADQYVASEPAMKFAKECQQFVDLADSNPLMARIKGTDAAFQAGICVGTIQAYVDEAFPLRVPIEHDDFYTDPGCSAFGKGVARTARRVAALAPYLTGQDRQGTINVYPEGRHVFRSVHDVMEWAVCG